MLTTIKRHPIHQKANRLWRLPIRSRLWNDNKLKSVHHNNTANRKQLRHTFNTYSAKQKERIKSDFYAMSIAITIEWDTPRNQCVSVENFHKLIKFLICVIWSPLSLSLSHSLPPFLFCSFCPSLSIFLFPSFTLSLSFPPGTSPRFFFYSLWLSFSCSLYVYIVGYWSVFAMHQCSISYKNRPTSNMEVRRTRRGQTNDCSSTKSTKTINSRTDRIGYWWLTRTWPEWKRYRGRLKYC